MHRVNLCIDGLDIGLEQREPHLPDESENPWRTLLRSRLRGCPTPLLVMPDALWSAASLWAGSRAWIQALRSAGVVAGDRLVCALPEGPAFVQVLVACLWDEITCVPISAHDDVGRMVVAHDARAVVVMHRAGLEGLDGVFVPDAASQPPDALPALRGEALHASREVALCFAAGGADAGPAVSRWTNHELLDTLQRQPATLTTADARVLSLAGWHAPFGLIVGLLSPLLHADEIVRDASGGQDPDVIARTALEHDVSHLVVSPAQAERMLQHPACRELLHRVRDGVIGGGSISSGLRDALRRTRLRIAGALVGPVLG